MVSFWCEDLHVHGVSLISPANGEFAPLLEDIRRRTQVRNPDGPPFPPQPIPDNLEFAAILLNHSEKAITGLAIEWKFENLTGQHYSHRLNSPLGRQSLLPFGLRPEQLAVSGYWQTILHGSKRLLVDTQIIGDNTDVRPPRGDEVWRGGGISGSGGGRRPSDRSGLRSVVLVIDGVFFADAEFVGPNEMNLWEDIYYEREVKLESCGLLPERNGSILSVSVQPRPIGAVSCLELLLFGLPPAEADAVEKEWKAKIEQLFPEV